MTPPADSPRQFTDAQAAELVRAVRTRRDWPRPPTAAFWLRLSADACFIASLLAVIVIGVPGNFAAAFGISLVAPAGLFVAWFVLRLAANRVCRRLRRRAMSRAGLLCINCHYSLPVPATPPTSGDSPARTPESLCPECREPYRPEEVCKDWEFWQPGVWFY